MDEADDDVPGRQAGPRCVAARDTAARARILIVCGSGRAADEDSKSRRHAELAREVVEADGAVADVLDLRRVPATGGAASLGARWAAADGIVIAAPASGELPMLGGEAPRRLAGRAYGLIVNGIAGIESQRRRLSDRLERMGLVRAGRVSGLSRYLDAYGPGFDRQDAVDADRMLLEDVRHVARSVVAAVTRQRREPPLELPGSSAM